MMKSIDDDIRREHGAFEGDEHDDNMFISEQAFWDRVAREVRKAQHKVEDAILVDEAIYNLMRDCHMMKTKVLEVFIWNINGRLYRAKCLKCNRIATTEMFDRQFTIDCKYGVTQFEIKIDKPCQCGGLIFRIQDFKGMPRTLGDAVRKR